MMIYLKGVPEDLHRAFKSTVAAHGETIKAALLRLMAEEVERAQKKGAKR